MQKEKTKILVVDDSETHRQFLTYVLSSAGYQVQEAKDGIEALKLASEIKPQLMITDILMPGMDGYEVIENFKESKELEKIKIILYTAQYQKNETLKLTKLFGIKYFLDKPAEKKDLLVMVKKALAEKIKTTASKIKKPSAEKIAKQHLDLINSKLFKQVNDLEKLKSELENRIAERTKTLSELNEQLHDSATHDPLTGLFNRRYLDDFIALEIARSKRSGKDFVVVMLDIDHFKNFNDKYGHAVGDLVLCKIAENLKKFMRKGDVVCRFGGEEFIFILVDTQEPEIVERLESIRKALQTIEVDTENGKINSITVSMGFALFPKHGQDAGKIIQAADQALYHAKNSGRNCVVPFQQLLKSVR
jgi:diguanylate cyclase (GGDEF)-like protein